MYIDYIQQAFETINLCNKNEVITDGEKIYEELCKETKKYLLKNNVDLHDDIIHELNLKILSAVSLVLYGK